MAWMTYISHWFEQDDWYEGLQRVRYIYVVFIIFSVIFFFFFALLHMQLYFYVIYIVDISAVQYSEDK